MSYRRTCVSGVRFVQEYNTIYQDVNKMQVIITVIVIIIRVRYVMLDVR